MKLVKILLLAFCLLFTIGFSVNSLFSMASLSHPAGSAAVFSLPDSMPVKYIYMVPNGVALVSSVYRDSGADYSFDAFLRLQSDGTVFDATFPDSVIRGVNRLNGLSLLSMVKGGGRRGEEFQIYIMDPVKGAGWRLINTLTGRVLGCFLVSSEEYIVITPDGISVFCIHTEGKAVRQISIPVHGVPFDQQNGGFFTVQTQSAFQLYKFQNGQCVSLGLFPDEVYAVEVLFDGRLLVACNQRGKTGDIESAVFIEVSGLSTRQLLKIERAFNPRIFVNGEWVALATTQYVEGSQMPKNVNVMKCTGAGFANRRDFKYFGINLMYLDPTGAAWHLQDGRGVVSD